MTWAKLLRSGYVAYGLNENLAYYRKVEGSISNNKIEAVKNHWINCRNIENIPFTKCVYFFCFYILNACKKHLFQYFKEGEHLLSFQILLSCMNEKDFSVLANSNINSNTIIVNQCNENGIEQIKDKVIMFNVAENGLSRSRNLAISKSNKDICLLADDDEFFYDNLEEIILNTYKNCPKADIIIFEFENKRKNLSKNIRKLYFFEMLKISSVQISFKRNSIQEKNIKFDTLLGAGTGNGAGE